MITIEISPGELIDRWTILSIKAIRIVDQAKTKNIKAEMDGIAEQVRPIWDQATETSARLWQINEQLWDVEDRLRELERQQNFGAEFVDLARHVYVYNDLRAALKREINEVLGSCLMEEKSYAAY